MNTEQRAYEIWKERVAAGTPGDADQDWYAAEKLGEKLALYPGLGIVPFAAPGAEEVEEGNGPLAS